jgi:hypothetical protein
MNFGTSGIHPDPGGVTTSLHNSESQGERQVVQVEQVVDLFLTKPFCFLKKKLVVDFWAATLC